MNRKKMYGNEIAGLEEPRLSPDFAYRVLTRAYAERRRRKARWRLAIVGGFIAAFSALIFHQTFNAPDSVNRGQRITTLEEDFNSAPWTGLEQGRELDEPGQRSVAGYFFPDLQYLADFNSEYNAAETIPLDSTGGAAYLEG